MSVGESPKGRGKADGEELGEGKMEIQKSQIPTYSKEDKEKRRKVWN